MKTSGDEANIEYRAPPLIQAIHDGDVAVVISLLKQGANPNTLDATEASALFLAAEKGHVEIVRALVAAGADVNLVPDEDFPTMGASPLYAAAECGHVDVVRVLVSGGADVNFICGDLSTPLIRAADEGYAEIVRILLEAGAMTEHPRGFESALMRAAFSAHRDCVELLLSYGADRSMRDVDGLAAVDYARLGGRATGELCDLLRAAR